MDTNDSLRVASLWHSMHAISQQLSPVNGCSGIELLEADTFDLHCFQSLPGNIHHHSHNYFVLCLLALIVDFASSLISQEQSSLWFVNPELPTWRASLDTFMNSTLIMS